MPNDVATLKIFSGLGGRLMHHQNVSLQNAPSKRTLLTSLKRSKAGPPQLKRSKKYVLMVHFAVIRFDGASGACQRTLVSSFGKLAHTVVSKLITDRDSFWEELISDYRYRIALPEELISITETDLWEFQQIISQYRYRFSLEFQIISITDTDFGLKTN